jgi:F-type H+-transporting ATPase subunit b
MDEILHQLGELLLKAVPTFLLIVFLTIYLKKVFFKPLEKILQRRYEATEGARKLAQESLERATAMTAEYEAALRAARAEVYQSQEKLHKQLQETEAAQLLEARKQAEETLKAAKAEIGKEVATAKVSLEVQSETLANQIAETILRRSAA